MYSPTPVPYLDKLNNNWQLKYTLDTRRRGRFDRSVNFNGSDYRSFYESISDAIAQRRRGDPEWAANFDQIMATRAAS